MSCLLTRTNRLGRQGPDLYDRHTLQLIGETTPQTLSRSASHILSEDPDLVIPGYRAEREFGRVRILRRVQDDPPVRQWQDYRPITAEAVYPLLVRIDPETAAPPLDWGIRYAQ